jgi:hypothetical protein
MVLKDFFLGGDFVRKSEVQKMNMKMANKKWNMSGDIPGGSFLEKVFNKKANSSCSTKITNESCAARITVEPACPSVTSALVIREFKKDCTLRNPIKPVIR